MRLLTVKATAIAMTESSAITQTQVFVFDSAAIFVRAPGWGGTGFQKNALTGRSRANDITRNLRGPIAVRTATHPIPTVLEGEGGIVRQSPSPFPKHPKETQQIRPSVVSRTYLQEYGQHGGGKVKEQKGDEHDEPGPPFPFSVSRPEDDQADRHDPEIGKTQRRQEVPYSPIRQLKSEFPPG